MILNAKQKEVVNELDKNILLLASAGTGKTDVLSKRIANIINQGKAKSSEILCITFTNKACREMQDRIETVVGANAKDISIKTFHSFCFDVIKEQAKKRTDIFTDFLIFDEEDCKELIATCNYFDYPVKELKSFIDMVKSERARLNIYTDDYNEDIKKVIDDIFHHKEEAIDQMCKENRIINFDMKDYLKDRGHELIKTYNALLHNNHGLDFNDLIENAKVIFSDEAVVKSLSEKYKYINIDEVQDTSTLEYSIIEKIFNKNNILLCGDMFQTIYEWRGSNPDTIFNLYTSKYSPNKIVFNKNYRSTKNLTNASLAFLNNAFKEKASTIYEEGIISESPIDGDKIAFAVRDGIFPESKFIVDEINKLIQDGNDISKTCILTRDNSYNIALSKALSKALSNLGNSTYQFILVDQYKFFRRQEIKDIIAFLKLIANRNDSLSLSRIIERLPTGIGEVTLSDIASNKYKEIGIRLSDYIDPNVIKYGERYALLINELENNNVVIFDVESTGVDVTEDEIIQIAAIKIDNKGKVIEKFERFLKNNKSVKSSEFVHGFSDEFLRINGEDKISVFNDFLEFSKDTIIVGHNVQYDISILTSELERLKMAKPMFKGVFDTLDIYRRFYPNAINHKLETLSRIFDTSHKPSHNAMDDILATGELLVYAVNKYLKPTSMERMAFMSKYLKSFNDITNKLNSLFESAENMRAYEIIPYIINDLGVKNLYKGEGGVEKLERLRDFYSLLKDLDIPEKSNRDSLLDVIKMTGLSNGELEELIIKRSKKPRIPIITVHQSKGLEFENVFLAGMQEETFPSYGAVKSGRMDEDKRTFYVAMTRAKKRLYITSNTKGLYGYRKDVSRFVKLIPSKYIEIK
ncbi:3'-5' exonuclease [Clostridium celatum]|uniref:3'-5' exonuclease n=1 Tax=Clostridium celatum TaxID=36834 RepID=UPI00319E993C